MSMILNNLLLSPEGYQISRSVRLRSSASAYFNRTPGSAGDRQKFTISFWMKRGTIGTLDLFTGNNANGFLGGFRSDNTLYLYDAGAASGGMQIWSARVFRDPSAWYHIVIAVDTTQATDSNRFKVYINGVQETISTWNVGAGASRYPSLNANFDWNNTNSHEIGYAANYGYFDGYLTEFNNVSGQQLDASSFGETNPVTGVWQPKKYAGTYGTNGFYLNFADNSAATAAAIGKDSSGNGNNWTPNNISLTAGATYDSMLDVPTQWEDGGNGRGNYCTLLPTAAGSLVTLSNGNLTVTGNSASNSAATLSSIAVTSGLWYFENTITTVGGISYIGFGRVNSGYNDLNNAESFTNTNNYGGAYRNNGDVFGFGRTISSTSTFTTGDVLGLALDMDNGAAYVSKNGTFLNSGVPTSGSSKTGALFTWTAGSQTICPLGGGYNGSVNNFNFGQRPFTYTPPTGFKALNTLNLPQPTILKGNQYFDATLWTGNGGSQTITNSGGMQPDFAWVKKRSGSENHELTDAVRGANLRLASNTTGAESAGGIAFNSTGLSLTGGYGTDNESGQTYVGWQWKEGATQGFDIVTYTGNGTAGRTISHSLGVTPAMMIMKSRSNARTWPVYHKNLTSAAYYIGLETTNQQLVDNTMFNSTAPTSSVFTVGTYQNANAENYVAYLFSEVAGFSKFGSYTGNGSADGPFCFTGFLPRFIMVKRTNSTGNWRIVDTSRDPSNVAQYALWANDSSAEGSGSSHYIDILSNGFKIRNTSAETNASGGTFVYAAFASSPFKNSLAR